MISPTGYWQLDKDRVSGEYCDPGLCDKLVTFLKDNNIQRVYDFGCAAGKYVAKINEAGIDAVGFDGNPVTGEFANCRVLDLAMPVHLPPVSFILCLEVGEHIPAEYEAVFIDNIIRTLNPGGYLLLSWAIPGQGGYGHVNEKTNDDVIKLIPLKFNSGITEVFRESVSEVPWFKNTLMMFRHE